MKTEFDVESRDPCADGKSSVSRRSASSRRRWMTFAAACGFAIGCAAANADSVWEAGWPTSASGSGASAEAATDVQDFERWTDPDLSLEAIDTLRREAQDGDVDAAVAVTSRLIDRYERGGTSDELFEATVWIDRYQDNETFARSGLIARVQQRECGHKVLRLHRLCDTAE